MTALELTVGAACLLAWAATFPALYRLVRAPDRAPWLRDVMNVEYLLLAHMAVFLVGLCLGIDGLFPD